VKEDPTKLVNPSIVFALGTWEFPNGGDCAPLPAIEDLPADGALLFVYEYKSPTRSDASPRDFRRSSAESGLGPLEGPFECAGGKTHMIRFGDKGRFFQAHTVFGRTAASGTRSEMEDALGSLTVEEIG
jgi:hypothetical protein